MSSEDLSMETISRLLEDVQLQVTPDLVKRHLQKLSRAKLQAWVDSAGLDLMHHAILESNLVYVSMLLTLGHFKPPHQPLPPATDWTYVHLAAVLGQRAMVSMLLQERPFDNKRVVLDWDLFHTAIAPKLDVSKAVASIVPAEDKERSFPFLPLDLAARYGHVQCVKTILDFHIFQPRQSQNSSSSSSSSHRTQTHQSSGHIHMAVMLDSPYAVRILLTDQPQTEEVKNALDIALKMAKPECVDALLRFGVDTKLLFGGMNLFHVLFAYSKSFEESWFESLVSVTSVLLRHGHDVNACRPSRTFPLYSLLRCTRLTSVEKSTPFVMAALLLLLQAGADPTFDEVFVEEAVRDVEQNTAFGRRPYSSGLHCVIDTAYNYMEEVSDPEHVTKYAYKLCDLLLHHGADASFVGRYRCAAVQDSDRGWLRGSVLHALCDAMPSLGPVDSSLLLLLLRHGGDADACVDGRYPLTAYFDALFSRSFTAPDLPPPAPPPPPQQGPDPTRRHSTPWGVGAAGGAGGAATASSRGSAPARSLSISIPTTPPPGRRLLEHGGVADVHIQDVYVNVRRACRMLGFMSLHSQQHVASMLRARLASLPDDDDDDDDENGGRDRGAGGVGLCLRVALREVEKYAACVPSLRRCCAITVWRLCRRHAGNVYSLPLPGPLIDTVMNYV